MGEGCSRGRRAALACLAAWGLGGCSWAFMTRPPEGVAQPPGRVECTESKGAPALDWVAGGVFAAPGFIGLLVAGNSCESGGCTEDDVIVGLASLALLGVAALYVASATAGEDWARRCGELRCASGVEASCRKLPLLPGPPPPPEPSPPWDAATDAPPSQLAP